MDDDVLSMVLIVAGIFLLAWLVVSIAPAYHLLRCDSLYPDWGEACERIIAGDIWVGMTKEQVRYAFGRPHNTIHSSDGLEEWIYQWSHATYFFYFKNEMVQSWTIYQ